MADLAYILLISCLVLSFVGGGGFIALLAGKTRFFIKYMGVYKLMVFLSFIATASLYAILTYSYISSDFSVRNVFENSFSAKPLIYKITGVWGNHEGSMLLFLLIICCYILLFSLVKTTNKKQRRLKYASISFMMLIFFLITLYIAIVSNPFLKITPPPPEGLGLNPLLQDIGLAIHPPLLYMGYAGCLVLFGMAVAILILPHTHKGISGKQTSNNGGSSYITTRRIFANTALKFAINALFWLTCGIGFGSNWAYRELGWGGFWFWDPVENSSLMPWLAVLALLHSLIAYKKKQEMFNWCIFLSLLCFLLALFGFFLVRSGILTSVHSFAASPERGIFMLIIWAFLMLFSLGLFFMKIEPAYQNVNLAGNQEASPANEPSKNGFTKIFFIKLNNLITIVALFTIALGILYPILLDVFSKYSISVGGPYYNKIFAPITLISIMFLAFVPSALWSSKKNKACQMQPYKQEGGKIFPQITKYLLAMNSVNSVNIVLMLFGTIIVGVFLSQNSPQSGELFEYFASIALIFACSFMVMKSCLAIYKTLWHNNFRLQKLPASFYGMHICHIAFVGLVFAVIMLYFGKSYQEFTMKKGETITHNGLLIKLQNIELDAGANFIARRGVFAIKHKSYEFTLAPEVRYYTASGVVTNEAAIKRIGVRDIHLLIGQSTKKEKGNKTPDDGAFSYQVRIQVKPYMIMIWASSLAMAMGLLVSLIGKINWRSLRVANS